MEVGNGLVYPGMSQLEGVQVRADCAVVKIDYVHEFAKNIKLEVPPDDMTTTLRDAVARRVQWRRAGIHIDPADADSVPTSQPQPQSAAVPPTFSEPCPQLPDTRESLSEPHPPVPTQPQAHATRDKASNRKEVWVH
ncbi:uncharacterized protein LOC112881373 [Panicum hallii]|uniref:uncharacterized protein LOC112881373 n=1 Tax=Panicum hallii TaxID=206008 RepID=UPI000DF4E2C5|nr:uncharacterized protein LOC112881373 [Panicum hallii]